MNEARQLKLAGFLGEARNPNRRSPKEVKRDIGAMLDIIAVGKEMRDKEIIDWGMRELKALEDELKFIKYGTTAAI
jgi:hypothetical protein